jgi:hypothetical protein
MSHQVTYQNLVGIPAKQTLLRKCTDDRGNIWFEVMINGPIERTKRWRSIVEFEKEWDAYQYLELSQPKRNFVATYQGEPC